MVTQLSKIFLKIVQSLNEIDQSHESYLEKFAEKSQFDGFD